MKIAPVFYWDSELAYVVASQIVKKFSKQLSFVVSRVVSADLEMSPMILYIKIELFSAAYFTQVGPLLDSW